MIVGGEQRDCFFLIFKVAPQRVQVLRSYEVLLKRKAARRVASYAINNAVICGQSDSKMTQRERSP